MEGNEVTILILLLLSFFGSLLAGAAEMGLRQLTRDGLQNGAAEGQASASTHLGLTVLRQAMGGVTLVCLVYLLAGNKATWSTLAVSLLGALALLLSLPALAAQLGIARALAVRGAPLLAIVASLATPWEKMGRGVARLILGRRWEAEQARRSGPESSILIPVDDAATPPDERDLWMIRAILRLERSTVREIMVPRVDVLALSVTESVSAATTLMAESGHSRFPIYEGNIDHVLGILHARDLLSLAGHEGPPHDLRSLLHPVRFVPETRRLDQLLPEFLAQRRQMAVVVDEYGGTAGLVTLEDVLEEIVGEIADEFDADEPEAQVVSEDEVVVDARISLDYLREHFGMEVSDEGFDTVGGFTYHLLGKVPNPGDEATANGLRVHVLTTLGKRIKKVRVVREPSQ